MNNLLKGIFPKMIIFGIAFTLCVKFLTLGIAIEGAGWFLVAATYFVGNVLLVIAEGIE